ncbi:hypothetical protein CHGG_09612 [Chaetomium globosum CBS 148.51]|uniref:NADH-ubiquinone oxidoreductase 21.3 kDa subunit n=1 Tax=Chaetomium globosum (strain ATCC 6205 / CBS 148.51 / DSM 1962 / NBRC 6347 / NRRL 1970) TaxID=306901 RepID=Q2GQZ2_CHAGB|nr:uncharacterized protein CHGG_09612 [Chaetomium globosum CBS 148.51]EAQ83208.1 hypothetical protein CHGG_09612 [Chaetomium globosum CBS 148.51]
MAPTGDDHYHPKDTIHLSLYQGAGFGGIGLLFAAVRNSLSKTNVGPWTTFTKHGGIAATFAVAGTAYEFTRCASANLREKDDYWNHTLGGFVAGAALGLRTGRMPRILGYGVFAAVVTGTYDYAGGTLKGYWNRPEADEYERKETLRKTRRRPIEETIAEIGEGRGIKPPGYEERRRERIKERYGIEINPVNADPDAS